MLKSRNLTNVLSQSVQQDREGSVVISTIVCTSTGRPVASAHNTRPPPSPHAGSTSTTPPPAYQIDRGMKTKVYGLLASQAWKEYSQDDQEECNWISVRTTDALLLIHPVRLKSEQLLLLILVADPSTAMGLLEIKAKQTVGVLEDGLADFKIHE